MTSALEQYLKECNLRANFASIYGYGKPDSNAAYARDVPQLIAMLTEAMKGLEEYGNRRNWRYKSNHDVGAHDAWLDFKPDHACKTYEELGGYKARLTLTRLNQMAEGK